MYDKFCDVDEIIPVSAKYGHGVEDVKDWILSKIPLGPAYFPKVIRISSFSLLIWCAVLLAGHLFVILHT